jgi:hypothetical protein
MLYYLRGAAVAPVQLTLAAAVVVGACVCAAFARRSYYFSSDRGPYSDLGFEALPAWTRGEYPHLTLQLVTVFFLTLVFGMFLSHRTPWASLRRFLLVFGTAQLLAVVCHLSTFMADPNPGWKGRPPELFPVLFTVGGLYAGFYREAWPRTGIAVMAVGLAGTLLSLACRMQYTVDALCDAGIAAATFFTYEWEMRSRWSVTRRGRFFAWLEADTLADAPERNAVSPTTSDHRSGYGSTDEEGSTELLTSTETVTGEVSFQSLEFRTVVHVSKSLTEFEKRHLPVASFLMLWLTAAFSLLSNLIAGYVANAFRALHRGKMPDFFVEHLGPVFTFLPTSMPNIVAYGITAFALFDAVFVHPFPLVALSRVSAVIILCFSLRFFVIASTVIGDDPFDECMRRVHPGTATCGDILYSGHTISVLCAVYCLTMFRESRAWFLICAVYTVAGLFFIVASSFHYTRDVLTAAIIFCGTKNFLNATLFGRPDKVARSTWRMSLDLPYYVARDRVLTGSAESGSADAPRTADGGPRSCAEAMRPRYLFAQVRPTGQRGWLFETLLGSRLSRN